MSTKLAEFTATLKRFVEVECIPGERVFDQEMRASTNRWGAVPTVLEKLKLRAKELGLWNLWITKEYDHLIPDGAPGGHGLTLSEYAPLCEIMSHAIAVAPEACNSSAPDTGNMEVLMLFGSQTQKTQWLVPLLNGEIRSSFLMTEPDVASSDATNIQTSIRRDGDSYVINGRKWWSTGAMDPRCKFAIVMGKTDPSADVYHQQSMIIVPINAPGVEFVRPMTVFGYDDAPFGHAEIVLNNVRVPAANLIGGEGQGFAIAQARLGPGRIHHCMRAIGFGERALHLAMTRITTRRAFGKLLAEHATVQADIAKCRIDLEAGRQLVLKCAEEIDQKGSKGARSYVSIIKVFVPQAVCRVLDAAIQLHGAAGFSDDTILARGYAHMRTLRVADGPDEVHLRTIGMLELKDFMKRSQAKL